MTQEELKGLALLNYLVTNADNLKLLCVAFGNSHNHVVQECAGETVETSVFLLVGRTGDVNLVTFDGEVHSRIEVSLKSTEGALHGDVVIGVSQGYQKVLMIIGVGYKAVKTGKTLQLFLGHSLMPGTGLPQEKFIMQDTDSIKLEVPTEDEIKKAGIDKMTTEKVSSSMIIVVKGIDKQEVGQVAAVIRSKRPPEPYHGKGVRYIDENVRRKAGKTGK